RRAEGGVGTQGDGAVVRLGGAGGGGTRRVQGDGTGVERQGAAAAVQGQGVAHGHGGEGVGRAAGSQAGMGVRQGGDGERGRRIRGVERQRAAWGVEGGGDERAVAAAQLRDAVAAVAVVLQEGGAGRGRQVEHHTGVRAGGQVRRGQVHIVDC